jgi:transcriptional regulator with XRE-family HTH domain
MIITGKQIAVARTLLDLSQSAIADIAGITPMAISKFESGKGNLSAENLNAIITYCQNKGLEFIAGNSARLKEDIRTYIGADEFRLFFDDIYQTASIKGGEIFVYNGIPALLTKWLGEEFYEMHSDRMTKIQDNFDFKVAIKKDNKNFIGADFAEYRWIPKKSYAPQMKYIYGNNLCWINFDDTVRVTVVENESIAKSERLIFQDLWDGLEAANE